MQGPAYVRFAIAHCPMHVTPLDLDRLKVFPLAERWNMTRADEILIDPDSAPPPCPAGIGARIDQCARTILDARRADATVMLIYGAHLLRNGAAS